MRRAINEIVDPSPSSVDSLWVHFEAHCAYCAKALDHKQRDAHVDHADIDGGNQLGNLVLACGACNGDEKREESWQQFLRRKVTDDAVYLERESRILQWFEMHPPSKHVLDDHAARVRAELEDLVEEFGRKCTELRMAINRA